MEPGCLSVSHQPAEALPEPDPAVHCIHMASGSGPSLVVCAVLWKKISGWRNPGVAGLGLHFYNRVNMG